MKFRSRIIALIVGVTFTDQGWSQFQPAISPPPNYKPSTQPSQFPPLKVSTPTGVSTNAQELKRLRALLVIDTQSNLGDSVVKDRETMRRLLTSNIPTDRLELTILQGRDATPARILDYYRNLQTGPDEALLFYYAGHGAFNNFNGQAGNHYLTMDAGSLERHILLRAMQAKRAGLIVLLTDCCSDVVKLQGFADVTTSEGGTAQARQLQHLTRCLFFQHRGIVDITAAWIGSSAYGDTQVGGFFTASLGRVASAPALYFPNGGRDFVTWNAFRIQVNDQLIRTYSMPRTSKIQMSFQFPR
jgi:hypothetical protein